MSQLQAVVFDLDGLMVDSEPVAQRAWEQVLREFDQVLDGSLFSRMVGLRLDDSALLVQQSYELPISAAELASMKQKVMTDLLNQGVVPMPGLDRLLEEIDQRQLPWAVATSSRRAYANQVLDGLGLGQACQAVAGGDEVGRGKPAPDIYLLAAERLGVSPSDCLALEDSVPGCRAAVGAGMVTVAVPGGHADRGDFGFVHRVLDSLWEVATHLDSLLTNAES